MDLNKILEGIEKKEELIEKINQEVGKAFVPRSEFNAKNEELKQTIKELEEREKKITELSTSEADMETMVATIEKLKSDNEEMTEKFAEQMKEIRISSAIEREVSSIANPDAVDLIPKLIDKNSLILNDDGSVLGLKEQVEELRTERKSLFKSEDTSKPHFTKGQKNNVEVSMTKEQIQSITDPVERREAIRQNIELFKN